MKDVENCKILTIVETFLISPHYRCKKIEIYPVLLQNQLVCGLHCFVAIYAHFVLRKILAKNVPCGESEVTLFTKVLP